MERRGFVTGLVPDLWNVMNYKLYKYIYILYIWSRVKIVYGTFRGVPDVWNEGASKLGLFRTFGV